MFMLYYMYIRLLCSDFAECNIMEASAGWRNAAVEDKDEEGEIKYVWSACVQEVESHVLIDIFALLLNNILFRVPFWTIDSFATIHEAKIAALTRSIDR
jgi:hypothetical protein